MVHVSELQERCREVPGASALSGFSEGQRVKAAVLGRVKSLRGKRGKELQLSLRPSALAAAEMVSVRGGGCMGLEGGRG